MRGGKIAKSQESEYIESDPEVCGVQWVITSTSIMVWIIREQLSDGFSAEQIVGELRGAVSLTATAERRRGRTGE